LSVEPIGTDLGRSAQADPDKTALISGERSVSYAELDNLAERFAAGLLERGVATGDRVATVLPNDVDAVVALQGALRVGAAIMPMHPSVKHERLSQVLNRAEATLVVCDEARAEMARTAAAEAGGIPVFDSAEELSADGPALYEAPDDGDLAALMHTSGSTGGPKGVMLTQRNLSFVTGSIAESLNLSAADRILCVLPLSFGYGLSQLLLCMRTGATLVLEAGVALPGRIVQLLEHHRITGLPGVPTVFGVLLTLRGLAERELPDLRFLTNAGAGLPTATVAEVRAAFPNAELHLMYGQTECVRISCMPEGQVDERPASSGVPIPGTEAWIEDDDGNVLGPGEVGELIVRGEHVMQAYWRDEEATATRLREGRSPDERVMATNDLFRADEQGYLYFVSRRDDIIKSRGEKVPPRDVEEVLYGDPGVKEAAVVGVSDRLLGEAVHAHVAARDGHDLDPMALKRLCAEHLEDYMVPQQVVIHDELPRNTNGKIDRLGLSGR
jgi:long-chain acyl-CoA synthetase